MHGPWIVLALHLFPVSECLEAGNANTTTIEISTERKEVQIEPQNKKQDEEKAENNRLPELTGLLNLLQKQCPCPCSGVPHRPVCGKTTNGMSKTFDSQCHLICHNQCDMAERYAIVSQGICPVTPVFPPVITNRKNIYSALYDFENRQTDISLASSAAYTSILTPLDWQCDCSYCPETRWIRMDYYPICGERLGQKITFDSWCHFDCENRCIKQTGQSYLYLHKGNCELDRIDEIVIPRTMKPPYLLTCDACNSRCKEFFEPVCAKNHKDEYLSFKSRCHLRCHNQCQLQTSDFKEDFIHIFDGQCPWI